jgi:uncharacterized protein YecE (DUF72 family)
MIRTGTCSWTERTLIGSGEFYPPEVRTAEGRLRFYAGHFDTVEVDSSYYAIPDERTVSLWASRSPDNFIFHIKAYGALTGHGVDTRSLPADLRALRVGETGERRYVYVRDTGLLGEIADRFRSALLPLVRAGKLGLLVFQFPPWLTHRQAAFDEIRRCRSLFGEFSIAVEFRHGSWLTPDKAPSVFAFLRDLGITYVTADEPQYGSLATVPFLPFATSDTAYFRFHGRNRHNWLRKGIETSLRYDYFYSDGELRQFLPPLRGIAEKVSVIYAMFNNCHGASAVRNALRLKDLLKAENDPAEHTA